jgi:hypothetical protein
MTSSLNHNSAVEDAGRLGSIFIWAWGLVFFAIVLYRLRKRRRHIGSSAAGTVYDIIHEDKRKAIEIIVADKAAARDFEHADDDREPSQTRAARVRMSNR